MRDEHFRHGVQAPGQDELLRVARILYNEFSDCLREQGELTPVWNEDQCNLAGTEVLAWMNFAKIQKQRHFRFEHRLWLLMQQNRLMETRYRESASNVLRILDYWKRRLLG